MVQIDDAIKRVQTSFQRIEATRQARISPRPLWTPNKRN